MAIHQPNFLPRLSTLAKLFAADSWIVLDDVQFARRDFQHRARLAGMSGSRQHQWLSIPTHLPHGRSTLIKDAVVVDPPRSRRRVADMLTHYYGKSSDWPLLRQELDSVLHRFRGTASMAEVAEESTKVLLRLLGWRGRILHSRRLPARSERSQRLADLAISSGASGYLCGTGGMRYLAATPFAAHGLTIVPFLTPVTGVWNDAREVSAVRALMTAGVAEVAAEVREVASRHQLGLGSA
ncbi:WbqC family protein [Streptomyces tanashiensis]|uniref:WbqC family protein n=1 Tax=Streptomyces tanashiensis TaxID=67367 RepID=UPI0036EE3F48